MIRRCYSIKEKDKFKNYNNCIVAPCWLNFSNFYTWFRSNFKYDLIHLKLNLDKDMLNQCDNKIYSPNTCCFIPKNINLFFTNIKNKNTSGNIGVVWDKDRNKWKSQIRDFKTGKVVNIGRYKNKNDAILSYIKYRNDNINKVKDYLSFLGYSDDIVNKIKYMEEL